MFLKNKSFYLILTLITFVWAKSSYGKIASGTFIKGFPSTITKFASNNPHAWYKDFLVQTVLPNSTVFGTLVFWGEILTALSLTLGLILALTKNSQYSKLLLVTGLAGGVFLNLMFWLGSAWTSPSTDSLNMLMAGVELIALISLVGLIPSPKK